jgi:hypothetical protein
MHQVFKVLDEKVQGLQLVGENLLQGAEVGGDLRCYEGDSGKGIEEFSRKNGVKEILNIWLTFCLSKKFCQYQACLL